MIRNNKGQALIEFVLILPIFILLVLGMIDLGRIMVRKSELENLIADQISIWQKTSTDVEELEKTLEKQNLEVTVFKNETTSFITLEVKEKITWLTPIMSNLLDSYTVQIKRVIPNE